MPQLNTPFTYVAEWYQITAVFFFILVVVTFFYLPAFAQTRIGLLVASVRKSSPLEQFDTAAPTGPLAYLGLTIVGVWGLAASASFALTLSGSLKGMPLSPRSWAIAILAAILDTTRAVTGSEPNTLGWLPVVATLIVVVGGTNLLANIPGGYCLSTSLAVAGSLSLAVWLWVFLESLLLQGSRFWASFIPSGTPLLLVPVLVPIEILSFSARAFSLGVRLFSNVLAGHTLLAILAGFLLGGLSSGWIAGLVSLAFLGLYTSLVFLEVAVSLIQAYVFSVLTVSYLAGAL